jgi:hypothetical protein
LNAHLTHVVLHQYALRCTASTLRTTQGVAAALVMLTLVGLHFFEENFMYSWRSRVVVLEIAMGHDLRGIVEAATKTLGDAKVSCCFIVTMWYHKLQSLVV